LASPEYLNVIPVLQPAMQICSLPLSPQIGACGLWWGGAAPRDGAAATKELVVQATTTSQRANHRRRIVGAVSTARPY
jgi:hypothetical protein